MSRFRKILAVMQKEFLHLYRDNIALSVAFLAPFLMLAIVGFLYIQQKVTDLPVVVFDQDQSEISRSIIRSFGDSERFKIIKMANTYDEVTKYIQTEQAYMGIVIPNHMQKDIKEGHSSEVGLILNGTNILVMNTAANAANAIIQTISGGITMKVMEGYGITEQKAYQAVTALNFRTRIWYNPTLSYLAFMLLGLIGTILQQVTFLGVALSFVREKECHTWRQLIFSKLSWPEVMIGKFTLYFLIYSLDALVMYGLGICYFGLPMRGSALLVILATVLFIFVLTAIGMVISIIAQSASLAIEISMLIAVPSFLISGWTWPLQSMPWQIQVLSKMLPLTHFLEAMRSIVLMGSGINIVWPKLLILSLFAVICLPVAAIALNRKMAKG